MLVHLISTDIELKYFNWRSLETTSSPRFGSDLCLFSQMYSIRSYLQHDSGNPYYDGGGSTYISRGDFPIVFEHFLGLVNLTNFPKDSFMSVQYKTVGLTDAVTGLVNDAITGFGGQHSIINESFLENVEFSIFPYHGLDADSTSWENHTDQHYYDEKIKIYQFLKDYYAVL